MRERWSMVQNDVEVAVPRLALASMFQHRKLGPVVDRTPARATVTSDGAVGVGGVVPGYPEVHELL